MPAPQPPGTQVLLSGHLSLCTGHRSTETLRMSTVTYSRLSSYRQRAGFNTLPWGASARTLCVSQTRDVPPRSHARFRQRRFVWPALFYHVGGCIPALTLQVQCGAYPPPHPRELTTNATCQPRCHDNISKSLWLRIFRTNPKAQ